MNERTVSITGVDDSTARRTVKDQDGEGPTLTSVMDAVPKFVPVEDYTTFRAEYTLQDGDVIIHFFPTTEVAARTPSYWTRNFPTALDEVAQEYFTATQPRLQAKYTEELSSWWFRARGYGHIIDLTRFVMGFFDQLDARLDSTLATAPQ